MENEQLLGLAIAGGAVLLLMGGKSSAQSEDLGGGSSPSNESLQVLKDFLAQPDEENKNLQNLLNPQAGEKDEVLPSATKKGAATSANTSADVVEGNVNALAQYFGAEYLQAKKSASTGAVTVGANPGANLTNEQLSVLLNAAASGSLYGRSNVGGSITAFNIPNTPSGGSGTSNGGSGSTKKTATAAPYTPASQPLANLYTPAIGVSRVQ